ncbi:Early nodulin-like protein [Actinidia chinensis var. chinensis]|uniref:Early nodulin-like protein n=1 Tax=Actinidia chinensis var. chinensis TaxID=1590841 RepID=A0A2R6RZ25_ACTCC|nr:Early nodulin-like protein [Actinidia chinensis var. chinensis]
MASHYMMLLLVSLSAFHLLSVSSYELQVGDTNGWVVPAVNDSKFYNDWASENRFRVGDTIRFKYVKDSVLEVTEADYKKCNSTHPSFFSNTGNTVFKLDRSGSFYFISGAFGHCGRGQRMIVKVMSHQDSDSGGGSSGSTVAVLSFGTLIAQFALKYLF